ncbi:hypothetical protein WICPIJ_008918 [Wickerhamomyces pijperi]|uniref:Zn(2)-C6 fungal-type domain-containing protein n=1 Tax=Wickerhamomyces pijperi TaxID=599730 RepID=A0A9P8TG00_WICPI|nr:hypothetical protein WICPIJ_008918 [Wickerhamomyces pijperi]
MTMPEQSQEAKQQQKKRRVSKACDSCRKSKTKCDGSRPCTRCLQDNKICTFANKKRSDSLKNEKSFDSQSQNYIELLETRISLLVQGFNQILLKCNETKEITQFCKNKKLRDPESGKFDINKVLLELTPRDNLENLSQANDKYTINEIVNVSGKPRQSIISNSATSSSEEDDEIEEELTPSYSSSPTTSISASSSTTSKPVVTSPISGSSKLSTNSTSHVHKPQHHGHSHSRSLSSLPINAHMQHNLSSFNSLSPYDNSSSTKPFASNYTSTSSRTGTSLDSFSFQDEAINSEPSTLLFSPLSQNNQTYGLPTALKMDQAMSVATIGSMMNVNDSAVGIDGIRIKQELKDLPIPTQDDFDIQDSLNYINDLKWELSI